MAEFLPQTRIAAGQVEAVPGTFEALDAADYNVLLHDVTRPAVSYNVVRQGKPAVGKMTQGKDTTTFRSSSFTAIDYLRFSGDQETAPDNGKFFRACGLQESGSGTQIVYTYAGQPECIGLSFIVADQSCGTSPTGNARSIAGAVGTMSIDFPGVNQDVKINYTFTGSDEGVSDVAAPIVALTGQDTGAAEQFLGSILSWGGDDYVVTKANLDLATTVTPYYDPAATNESGIGKYKITSMDPKLTLSIYKIDESTSGIVADVVANSTITNLVFALTNHTITFTDCQIIGEADSDGDGILQHDLEFAVHAFNIATVDSVGT